MYNISASKVSMLELPPNWSFWDWCQLIQLPAPMCGYPFWNYRPLCTCPLAHISFIHFKTSWCCSVKVAGYNLMFFMAVSPRGIALVFLQNDYSDEFRNKVVVVFLLFSFLWPFSGYNQPTEAVATHTQITKFIASLISATVFCIIGIVLVF